MSTLARDQQLQHALSSLDRGTAVLAANFDLDLDHAAAIITTAPLSDDLRLTAVALPGAVAQARPAPRLAPLSEAPAPASSSTDRPSLDF